MVLYIFAVVAEVAVVDSARAERGGGIKVRAVIVVIAAEVDDIVVIDRP